MTCIISYIDDSGAVWMGADSSGSNGLQIVEVLNPKIWKHDTGWLVGGAGSFRANQILQLQFKPPKPQPALLYEQVVKEIVPVIRELLKGTGFMKVEDNQETAPDVGILLGAAGRVVKLQSDLSVIEYALPFNSTGSGYAHAMGAMLALQPYKMKPANRIERALKVTATLVESVSYPFDILAL